jgi:hypothetical protein
LAGGGGWAARNVGGYAVAGGAALVLTRVAGGRGLAARNMGGCVSGGGVALVLT